MKKWLLPFIVFAAFVIRIWGVTSNPPSLSWDEVSIGYNAYSILKTGMDEHGRWLPLDTFIAYGDYKPPLSIYLTVPFVAIFGLTELAVRLPSVLAGSVAVYLTYFIVYELAQWADKKSKLSSETVGLLTAVAMTFSPWSVMLSRGGFEANVGSTLIMLGMWLLLKAKRDRRYLIWSVIPFALSMYTFNSARYVAPVLWIFGALWSPAARQPRLASPLFLFLLLLLPLLPHLFSSEARLRYQEVNIFSDPVIVETANARIEADGNTWWAKIIHNRRWGYARAYLRHYLDNLEPGFLFIKGDGNPKFSTQETGQLYLWEAPFLFFGLLGMLAYERKMAFLLLFWLGVAIAPAGVARETPHALRTINTLPVWQIFIAYGIYSFGKWSSTRWWQMGSRLIIGFMWVSGVVYFLTFLFKYYPVEYAGEWQYGYKQALLAVKPIEESYKEIVVSDVIGRPYMYTAFYKVWDPVELWSEKKSYFDTAGFYHVDRLGKFRYVAQNKVTDYESGVLYILPPNEVPSGAQIRERIYLPNGEEKLVLFDVGI